MKDEKSESITVGGQGVVGKEGRILITGATGFIGAKVVEKLVENGYTNLRCFTRSSTLPHTLKRLVGSQGHRIEVIQGDLASVRDCERAADGTRLVYHVAGGGQGESFTSVQQTAVDTLKTLLEALVRTGELKRFVHVSSFAVYSNLDLPVGSLLDESCAIEVDPVLRGEPYTYAKVMQERVVREFGQRCALPYVILRPGAVYGPGNTSISGRIGIATSKVFLHLGNSNVIPFTYVDNCADAIVLSGLKEGIDGEVLNVVDDGRTTSRRFLELYAEHGMRVRFLSLPKALSYPLYCAVGFFFRVRGSSIPPKYNRRRWCAYWKGNTYTNEKLKRMVGWSQNISMEEGMHRYFEYCKNLRKSDA